MSYHFVLLVFQMKALMMVLFLFTVCLNEMMLYISLLYF